MKITHLLLIALLFSPSSQSREQTPLQAPRIELLNIAIESLGLSSARLAVHLEVHNPNASDLFVEEIRYELSLKQTQVKRGVIRQQERFPARGTQRVRVPVSLAYDQHFPAIMAALSSQHPAVYEIKGDIQIAGRKERFPFLHKGRLALPFNGS